MQSPSLIPSEADCRGILCVPQLSRGDILEQGEYYRAVKEGHLPRRDQDASDGRLGRRLHNRFYKDAASQAKRFGDNLSVNSKSCCGEPVCTLVLLGVGARNEYQYVIELHLEALRRRIPDMDIVAIYQPVESPPASIANPCHFELTSRRQAPLILRMEFESLWRDYERYEAEIGAAISRKDIAAAEQMTAAFNSVLGVVFDRKKSAQHEPEPPRFQEPGRDASDPM